jgi:drug/metabolite transporter (DMT)-like permease
VSRRRTAIFFLATAILFGGTFVAAKAGVSDIPPLLFVSFRFDIAAVLLLTFVVVTHPREHWIPRTRNDVLASLAAGVFAIGLANALIFVGEQYATSAVGSIIFSLNPVLTPVFAALLLSDERLPDYGMIGMGIAFVGVALVVGITPSSLFGGGAIGYLILFSGAVCAALGSVLIRWANADFPSTARTAWALPIAALLCHLLAFGSGEQLSAIQWSPTALLALGYVSVFSGALAYIVYFDLLDSVGAIRANLAFYVVPVVSAIGGWLLLGESITVMTILGFVVIALGFVVLGREELHDELRRLPVFAESSGGVSETSGEYTKLNSGSNENNCD